MEKQSLDRTADPRIYVCAVEQSIQPYDWVIDHTMYTYCPTVQQVMTPATDAPITTPDQCYTNRRSQIERVQNWRTQN